MNGVVLACLACGATHPAVELYRCPDCGGELDVRYNLARAAGEFRRRWRGPGSLWERFAALLPQQRPEVVVSLGEGGTPLVRADRLAARLGVAALWLKLESANPTGAFKDRQVGVGLSKAREWGARRFATVSSGNVAVSLAAYCAGAGAQALVWVAGDSAAAKLQQVQVYGARLLVLPDPRGPAGAEPYVRAVRGLREFATAHGLVPMVTARSVNPYLVEGAKTIVYEVVAALDPPPTRIAVPIGGGGLAGGLWKGLLELRALELLSESPRLTAGQRRAYFVPLDALADPRYADPRYYRPLDGDWAWSALNESGGDLHHVSDAEVRAAQVLLAGGAGVFAEPRGAYAFAALIQSAEAGDLAPDERVVCIVSGHGLKDGDAVAELLRRGGHAEAVSVDSLEDGLDRLVTDEAQWTGRGSAGER